MNDIELQALAALVAAETGAMLSENADRLRNNYAQAYSDTDITRIDCVVALDKELRRRKLIGQ